MGNNKSVEAPSASAPVPATAEPRPSQNIIKLYRDTGRSEHITVPLPLTVEQVREKYHETYGEATGDNIYVAYRQRWANIEQGSLLRAGDEVTVCSKEDTLPRYEKVLTDYNTTGLIPICQVMFVVDYGRYMAASGSYKCTPIHDTNVGKLMEYIGHNNLVGLYKVPRSTKVLDAVWTFSKEDHITCLDGEFTVHRPGKPAKVLQAIGLVI